MLENTMFMGILRHTHVSMPLGIMLADLAAYADQPQTP